MGMKRASIKVEGMSCVSCERRIEGSLKDVAGVASVKADSGSGRVALEYEGDTISLDELKGLIGATGYPVATKGGSGTFLALGIGIVLAGAYALASSAGLFNGIPQINAALGYGMLFAAGLLTSVHCVAMCGGIALSQSVGASDKPGKPKGESPKINLEQLRPGILYNGGRVISYTIVGAIVGAVGSVFDFSPLIKASIAGVAGLFMLAMGLKMMGLLSWLPSFRALFPVSSRKKNLHDKEPVARRGPPARRGPLVVGLLNGLMPCGPLQMMQLYALGTGSALAGAFSMFLFSMGTVPLMLSFGVIAAFLPRKVVPIMLKASAVLVMFLGVLTLGRSAALAGVSMPLVKSSSSGQSEIPVVQVASGAALAGGSASREAKAEIKNGIQTVRTVFGANNYADFVAQAGVPLRWIITIAAGDLNGCNNTMIVPAYGIKKKLVPGENIVEFTPNKEGVIPYSCWMGMIRSRITVVGKLSDPGAAAAAPGLPVLPAGQTESVPAASCCGG